jgi:hypothetical protein
MTKSAKEQATALAHISLLKMTQKAVLTVLNAQAHAARQTGDNTRARALTQMTVTLSQKNLAIHRAKQQALRAHDIGIINSKLSGIAAQNEQILKDLNRGVDALTKAAQYIDLLRRAIDILS